MRWRSTHVRLLILCSVLVGSAAAVGLAAFDVQRSMTARGLPYPEADRLVTLVAGSKSWSPGMLESIRTSTVFDRVAGIQERSATLQFDDQAEIVRLESVSSTYFELLGLSAARGRVFSADEDRRNSASAVVVISHRLWQRRLGGATDAIGRVLEVDGKRLEVIGVLPDGAAGLIGRTDLWTPLGSARWLMGDTGPERPSSRWFEVFGRLAPGVTVETASSRLAVELPAALSAAGIPPDLIGSPPRIRIAHLSDTRVSPAGRRALPILQGAAATLAIFVLATLASLLLLRQQRRTHEVAVQLALGAERWHVIWPAVRDGAAIALCGTAIALLVRPMLVAALQGMRSPSTSFGIVTAEWLMPSSPISLATVGTFSVALVVCVTLSAAVAAAVLRRAPRQSLRAAAGATGLSKPTAPAVVLLSVQSALACAVLAGALLMVTALSRIIQVDRGYDWEGVFTARLILPGEYDASRKAALLEQLTTRLSQMPGIDRAGLSTCAPGAGRCRQSNISRVDGQALAHGSAAQVGVHTVSSGYFAVIGATITRGRALDASDALNSPLSVVVTDKLAAQLWPGGDPIGRELEVYTANGSLNGMRRVAGTVADIRFNVDDDSGLDVFLPITQAPPSSAVVFLKSAGEPALGAVLEREVSQLDRRVAVNDGAWLAERLADSLSTEQLVANVLTGFACVALVLAVLGTYTMTTQSVDASRRELAVRVALGATASQVGRMIARRGALAALVGATAGTALAYGGGKVLSSLLHGTPEHHIAIFAAPALVVAALGAALLLPIRRANRIDVVQTMREP